MHELSIASEIISIVEQTMIRERLTRIDTVNIRLGALTGVNPDALAFGFEAATAETRLDGAELVIEQIPVRGICRVCNKDFEAREFVFICSHCGSSDLDITQGEELEVSHLIGN